MDHFALRPVSLGIRSFGDEEPVGQVLGRGYGRWRTCGRQRRLLVACCDHRGSPFIAVRLVVVATLVVAARIQDRSAHRVLVSWDAQSYRGIAENGYGFTRSLDGRLPFEFAFFPLYPLLERAVSLLTELRYVDSGLVISACASAAAAWGISR